MSNRIVVKICGEEYPLFTDDSIEYTQSVGSYVNMEMQKMLSSRLGRMEAAVMTALNIADELFKVRETDEQLRAQIKNALDEAAKAKAEVNALKRESLSLQKKLEKAEKQPKAVKGRAKAETSEPEEVPALDEAEMAQIVEKSKRPRRTRKTKVETVTVESVEETPAEVVVEPEPEAVTEEPKVSEPAAETPKVADAVMEEPKAAEAVAEEPKATVQ